MLYARIADRLFRRLFASMPFALMVANLTALAQAPGQPGTAALNFRARTLATHPIVRTLADYRGKVVLLAIWATWCPGCKEEMASMQRLYSSYAADGFRVVAISIDKGSDENVLKFARENALTFDILRDEDARILQTYFTQGVPTTILIDRAGIIRRRNLAAVDWDIDPRLSQIKLLLNQRASLPGSTGLSPRD
jgi:peroxiredoxin